MAFTTPPTFTDDTVLSASQLNTLADNQEHFNGLARTANVPFARNDYPMSNGNEEFWQVRHRSQYLNIFISWSADATWVDHVSVEVFIDGVSVLDQDPISGTSPTYLNIDVDAIGSPPSDGDWYEIKVRAEPHDASHVVQGTVGTTSFQVRRMFESDTQAS